MTIAEIKTFLADSFRLRPYLLGIATGLVAPYVLRLVGWIA